MKYPLVISIVVNWNLKKELGECLNSLRNTSYPNHKIVVVDNGSTDGSPSFVAECYPEVDLIALPTNQGYAAGLNAGILRAMEHNADYVFLLNNDVLIPDNTISILVETMESHKDVGIASPKVLFYHYPNKIYALGDRIYPWSPLPVRFGHGKKDSQKFKGIMEFDYVTGCAMMVRSDIFRIVGLFETSYFMYYEDADFCRRVRDRGYRIICIGHAIVYHKAAQSTSQNKSLFVRIRARNRVRFYKRYRHGPHPWLTYISLAIIAMFHSMKYILTGEIWRIKPYILGLWEGWNESKQNYQSKHLSV